MKFFISYYAAQPLICMNFMNTHYGRISNVDVACIVDDKALGWLHCVARCEAQYTPPVINCFSHTLYAGTGNNWMKSKARRIALPCGFGNTQMNTISIRAPKNLALMKMTLVTLDTDSLCACKTLPVQMLSNQAKPVSGHPCPSAPMHDLVCLKSNFE